MQRFRIYTLVDITRTNVYRDIIDPKAKKQQDNFQTLHQTLEMRSIVFTETDPKQITMDWTKYGYGKKEKTWVWDIYTERDDLYMINDDPTAAMQDDVEFVPFTIGCEESAEFKQCFFSTKIKPTNILFELLDK